MKIKNRTISSKEAPLIIAELGINHGGDLLVAEQLVKSAADRGCEVIKHQTHFLDDEMTPDAKQIMPPNADVSIWDVMEKCSLTQDEEIKLKRLVEDLGMIYISTPFSRSAADFLNDINVPAFKIGSGECDNLLLLEHIADFGKPIILSTGMQNLLSVEKPVEIFEKKNIHLNCFQSLSGSMVFIFANCIVVFLLSVDKRTRIFFKSSREIKCLQKRL